MPAPIGALNRGDGLVVGDFDREGDVFPDAIERRSGPVVAADHAPVEQARVGGNDFGVLGRHPGRGLLGQHQF
jgi:hypothetical protein